MVIVDECHVIRKKLVEWLVRNDILGIGLSATPFSPRLGNIYQTVVNAETTNELLRGGHLCPVRVVGATHEVDVAGLIPTNTGEWAKDDVSERVMQITGEIVPEWEKHTTHHFGGPVPTVVFCVTVADSEKTAAQFAEAGHDFQVVHYKQTSDEKQAIIGRYRRGQHQGLISCTSLSRGFDVPNTRCLVDAYPLRKSLEMHIQKTGRVMRNAPGKDYGLIIDHCGNWAGFYDATHEFFEYGVGELGNSKLHATVRDKDRGTKDYACKVCGVISAPAAKVCEGCGNEKPKPKPRLVSKHGSLGEIDSIDGQSKMTKQTQKLRAAYDGDWWPELCAVAARMAPDDPVKQLKIARAKHKDMLGCWPQRGRVLEIPDRPPHAVVAGACARSTRAFYARNRGRKR